MKQFFVLNLIDLILSILHSLFLTLFAVAYMSTTYSASTPAPRPPTSMTSESQSLFGEEVKYVLVENPQQQGTKRRTTSDDVWNHFKKENIDGKVKAQCNYYGRLMAGASTSIRDDSFKTTHSKKLSKCSEGSKSSEGRNKY